MPKLYLQTAGRTAAKLWRTLLRCKCLPLTAGLCVVTATASTFNFVGLIRRSALYFKNLTFYWMNMGADTQKRTNVFCLFFLNCKAVEARPPCNTGDYHGKPSVYILIILLKLAMSISSSRMKTIQNHSNVSFVPFLFENSRKICHDAM